MPFKVTAGTARYTLRSEFAAPAQPGGNWTFALGGGWIVLDPPAPNEEGLILKRVAVRGSIDLEKQRIALEQGDIGTKELGSQDEKDVTVALSGLFDYGSEPRLAIGVAGNQMSVGALKRLWPVFVAPKVRDWVVQHIVAGTVERVDIATNAPSPRCRQAGRRSPRKAFRLRSSAAASRCSRSPACRRSATPTSMSGDRTHRDGCARSRQRGRFAGAPAGGVQRRVRGAQHASRCAAGARAVQARRHGAGGRRAAGARPVARILRRAIRSHHDARIAQRADQSRDAAAARPAERLDRVQNQR